MLRYTTQYNILSGVFTSFRAKRNKKQFTIRHTEEKIESMRKFFKYRKFEEWTDSDFKILSIYIMFYKSPASLIDAYGYLKETGATEVNIMKEEIRFWKKYLNDDIRTIKNYNNKVTDGLINDLYIMNKIKWYTVFYYYYYKGIDISEAHGCSRICKKLFKDIIKIHVYVELPIKIKDISPLYINEIGL